MWTYWQWEVGSKLPVYRTNAPDTSATVFEVWDGESWVPAKPGNAVFRSLHGEESLIGQITEAEASVAINGRY